MANPQLENGGTSIANEVLEVLAQSDLSGGEFRLLLAVIRKTWGWHKKEDAISISQLEEMTNYSTRTIIYLIQNLEAKRIILIKRDLHKTNKIKINKDYETWLVQNLSPQYKKVKELAKKSSAKLRKQQKTDVSSAKLCKNLVQNSVKNINSFAHTNSNTNSNTKYRTFSENDLFVQAWRDYKDMRKKIKKPMTAKAEQMAIKKLEGMTEDLCTAIQIVEQSIEHSWNGLFPLKGKSNQMEQDAIDMIKQYGQELGYWKFVAKYSSQDLLKVKHIINL